MADVQTEYFQLSPRASPRAGTAIGKTSRTRAGQAAEAKEKAVVCLQVKQAGDRARLFTFGSLSAVVPTGDRQKATDLASEPASKPDAAPRTVASPNRRRRQGWKESLRDHERHRGRGAELTIPEGPRLRTASRSMSRSRADSRESSRGSSRCGSETPSACSSLSQFSRRSRSSVKLTVPEGPVLATEARSQSRRRREAVPERHSQRSSSLQTGQPLQQLHQQLEVLTHRLQQADLAGNQSLEQQVQQVLQQQRQLLQQQLDLQSSEIARTPSYEQCENGTSCQQKNTSGSSPSHPLPQQTDSLQLPLESVPKMPESFQEHLHVTQPQAVPEWTHSENQDESMRHLEIMGNEQVSDTAARLRKDDEAKQQDQQQVQEEEEPALQEQQHNEPKHDEQEQEQYQQQLQHQEQDEPQEHRPEQQQICLSHGDSQHSQTMQHQNLQPKLQASQASVRAILRTDSHKPKDSVLEGWQKSELAASPSSRAERAREQALKSLEQAQASERAGLFCFNP